MIHVVLCDDHAILRRGIRDTLAEATDISVTAEAGSYAELREQLRDATCDVLLLDINMPGLNGIEVLRQMKELRADLPVILCSAYPEYKQDFGSWASDDYVVKSANLDELKAVVRKHLG